MPLLAVHVSIAEEVVESLQMPRLKDHAGAFLLGATAPDRRVLTQQPRQETHYFHLTKDGLGDGLKGLRDAHPELLAKGALDWEARAFLAGYVCHLAADETWIVNVYRRFFDDGAPLGDDPARNILDRALQFAREREVLNDQDRVRRWRSGMGDSPPSVPDHFIDAATLKAWHGFISGRVLAREGGWHEFPRFIGRYRNDPGLTEQQVEEFLANPEAMFARVFEKVPRDILVTHNQLAVEASVEAAREVLE